MRCRETEMRMLRQINVNTKKDIIQNEKICRGDPWSLLTKR